MRRPRSSVPLQSRIIAVASASALVIAACVDPLSVPSSPRAPQLPMAASAGKAAAIPVTPNNQRYRVKSAAAATGRSGSAEVTARALLGKDGKTVLEMSTGALDAASTQKGAFTKAQVKMLDPGNASRVMATANYVGLGAGYFTATYAGLGVGFPLQVQANVKGADGNRTDVVTVSERVKRRPDLAVTLGNLGNALVRAPTEIAASVRELNGDVGAVADCVLLVDAVTVDRAKGIWVDAGDAVSCAFMHTFATVGQHGVTVRVEGVAPGDWDVANNEASGSIAVADPSVAPQFWNVYAYQSDFSQVGETSGYMRSPLPPTANGYWEGTFAWNGTTRVTERIMTMSGNGTPFVSFPLQKFRASFWSEGRLIQAASLDGPIEPTSSYAFADPVYAYRQSCVFRMDDATAFDGGAAGRLYLSICSYEYTSDGGATWTRESSIYVRQYAGTVTYWSAGFIENRFRAADGTMVCYPGECYTYNDAQTTTTGAPPFLTLGDEVRASFDVIGANGVHMALDKTVSLVPFSFGSDQPYGCRDLVDPTLGYLTHFCDTNTWYQRGKVGDLSSN
jgi:hypothetical protein